MYFHHKHIEVVEIGKRRSNLNKKFVCVQKGGPLKLATRFGLTVRTCLRPALCVCVWF